MEGFNQADEHLRELAKSSEINFNEIAKSLRPNAQSNYLFIKH